MYIKSGFSFCFYLGFCFVSCGARDWNQSLKHASHKPLCRPAQAFCLCVPSAEITRIYHNAWLDILFSRHSWHQSWSILLAWVLQAAPLVALLSWLLSSWTSHKALCSLGVLSTLHLWSDYCICFIYRGLWNAWLNNFKMFKWNIISFEVCKLLVLNVCWTTPTTTVSFKASLSPAKEAYTH